MEWYKYLQPTFEMTRQESIHEYNLTDISYNVKVYINIWKGIYGLTQSGKIAHGRLKKFLDKQGYQPVKLAPGIWTIVDEFWIKYVEKKKAEHFIQ